jgi:DNA invertase Pin-like site-specific DNA recombinase
MKMMALYCRVSTSEQTTKNQRIKLVEHARRMGWQYEIFEEVESTTKSRPIKADLLQRLRRHEFDGIAVYRLDRYARSTTELLLEIMELVRKGIEFHSLTEQLDFGTASGRLHLAVLSAFCEFERSLLRERVILGQQRAKQQGIRIGRPMGSTDRRKRKTAGYYEREKKKRFLREYQKILPPNNYDFINA